MESITIADSGDHFQRGGRPLFYLADTIWSAFISAAPAEWEEYLSFRRRQGFNVLQIAVTPQWDASRPHLDIAPFRKGSGGSYNFHAIDENYFARAAGMLQTAREYGFVPALVVLWCDYVPETWLSRLDPQRVMPYDAVKPYARHVAETFSRFDPIYIISGDTDFGSDETAAYYMAALEGVKSVSPQCLATLHLAAGRYELPESIARSGLVDFYMYQSGHMAENQDFAYAIPEKFRELGADMPIVNGEPCYEGIAHAFKRARFNAFDVRRATWHSLLSGAKAGIAYGAHGVWGWHTGGKQFDSAFVLGMPYEWQTALGFRGAWDVSFAAWLFGACGLFDLEARRDLLNTEKEAALTPEIEASVSASRDLEKVAIYLPYNAEVELDAHLPGMDWTVIDLRRRYFSRPDVRSKGGRTVFGTHAFDADVLIFGTSR
ncbi:MAG: DUF4038 domain-containing protein [Actinobacteria bacterium]|nr:DUF4038 domain-containing protein [Actinomycetota bacterium]